MSNDYKVYVDVNEDRLKDGRLVPLSFVWEDGERYEIDKILDVRRAASLKAGGAGLRYTVRVGRRETFMFLEEGSDGAKWFMERRRLQ
ncbi:MAG: hypothetical protein FWH01_18040 [Oscillospiraceae bacterium]|nr:hypothetical protein [Oscillospiraceae bacterium]